MLCACEQVVDVELGSGVPHISNLQALASPSPTIWPQALFDLDFTGNTSIRTQNTGGSFNCFCSLLSFLGPNMSCLPVTLGLFQCTQGGENLGVLSLQEGHSGDIKPESVALKHAQGFRLQIYVL